MFLAIILVGIALLLLSVRVIFSRSHTFLHHHACRGAGSAKESGGNGVEEKAS